MKNLLDFILQFLEHPLFANAIIIAIGLIAAKLIINRYLKNAQIEINSTAEKLKFEIQRKYMLVEIRVRHLLEIYPKLNDAMHAAARPYASYFTTITNKIQEIKDSGKDPSEDEIRTFIRAYFLTAFSDVGLEIENVQEFNNQLASASLFISAEVSEILNEIKKDIMDLFRLIRKEIQIPLYMSYNKQQLIDLIDRANKSVSCLEQNKDHVSRRMNKELDPGF